VAGVPGGLALGDQDLLSVGCVPVLAEDAGGLPNIDRPRRSRAS
jgi:hypothetical protein